MTENFTEGLVDHRRVTLAASAGPSFINQPSEVPPSPRLTFEFVKTGGKRLQDRCPRTWRRCRRSKPEQMSEIDFSPVIITADRVGQLGTARRPLPPP